MTLIEELTQLKTKLEEAKTAQAEIEGGIKEIKKTIQREFGFASIQDATQALEKMEAKIIEKETELNDALDTFMEKYGDKIEQFETSDK